LAIGVTHPKEQLQKAMEISAVPLANGEFLLRGVPSNNRLFRVGGESANPVELDLR